MSNRKIRLTNFGLKYNTLIPQKYRGFKRSYTKISTWFWRIHKFTQAYDFQEPGTKTSTLFCGNKHKHKHVISKRTRIYPSRWFQREHAQTQACDCKENTHLYTSPWFQSELNTHKHKSMMFKRTITITGSCPAMPCNWTLPSLLPAPSSPLLPPSPSPSS